MPAEQQIPTQALYAALGLGMTVAALTLGATALTFNATTGGGNPTAQTVAITNGGGGTLGGLTAAVVSYGGGPTGWLQTPTLNGTTAPATLTLQALTGSLAAGTYTALVQITAGAGATGSPQQVVVTFNVAAPSAVTVSGTVDFESVPNDTATNGPGAGRLLYANKTNRPIRGATVQLISTTAVGGVPAGTVLASGITSGTGTAVVTLPNGTNVPSPFRNLMYPSSGAAYTRVFNQLVAVFPELEANRGNGMAFRWRCMACGPRQIETTTDTTRYLVGLDGPLPFAPSWDYRLGVSQATSAGSIAISL